jgi:hypothetical protein
VLCELVLCMVASSVNRCIQPLAKHSWPAAFVHEGGVFWEQCHVRCVGFWFAATVTCATKGYNCVDIEWATGAVLCYPVGLGSGQRANPGQQQQQVLPVHFLCHFVWSILVFRGLHTRMWS